MNPEKDPFNNPEQLQEQALQADVLAQQQEQNAGAKMAEQWMEDIWKNSLEQAKQAEDSDAAIIERAADDQQVADARKSLEGIFGTATQQQIETKASATAFDSLGLTDHKTEAVAEELAEGNAATEVGSNKLLAGKTNLLESASDNKQAEESTLGIIDRNNGSAPKTMNKLVSKTTKRLASLGIKNRTDTKTRKAEIAAELALSNGPINREGDVKELDISGSKRGRDASNETVGQELIRAIGSPKRLSGEARQTLNELVSEDQQAAKLIFEAVARRRETGSVSKLTARRVGVAMEQLKQAA